MNTSATSNTHPPKKLWKIVFPLVVFFFVMCLLLYQWIFQKETHREATSPDGKFIAKIVKQQTSLFVNPVSASLEITKEEDGKSRTFTKKLRTHDMWIDIEENSYPLQWESNNLLKIGNSKGDFSDGVDVSVNWPDITFHYLKRHWDLDYPSSID